MKRFPVVATILVGLAIAAMIGLGLWQLERRHEKAVLLTRLDANRSLPPIAFPTIAQDETLLFRRAGIFCLQPTSWEAVGGHDAQGRTGWRQIAHCRTGAEGPGVTIQIGVSPDPHARPIWPGGKVSGYITQAPSLTPLLFSAFSHQPKALMLVADPPLAGLAANPLADLSAVPNNHLAYAVQWFLFALVAAIIYAIALRRRSRGP